MMVMMMRIRMRVTISMMDLVASTASMSTFVDRLVVAKHSKTEVFLDSDQLEDLDLIFVPGLDMMWVVHL